jgi:hypothetical protein
MKQHILNLYLRWDGRGLKFGRTINIDHKNHILLCKDGNDSLYTHRRELYCYTWYPDRSSVTYKIEINE